MPQPYPAYRAPAARRGLPFVIDVIVGMLGIIAFFLGFAPYEKMSTTSLPSSDTTQNFFGNGGGVGVVGLAFLLAAGLVALFSLLPNQTTNVNVIAGLSLAGFLSLLGALFGLFSGLDAGVGLILVLVVSFLQAVLACASVLITAGVLRVGAPDAYANYPQDGRGGQQSYRGPGSR
ncbi:DUF5336 domain-containing protein [Mycobacterium sp. MMS18-G62]